MTEPAWRADSRWPAPSWATDAARHHPPGAGPFPCGMTRVLSGVEQGMNLHHGMDVATAVQRWRLAPHPEGGYFRETYRSGLATIPAGWPGERALATAILYL